MKWMMTQQVHRYHAGSPEPTDVLDDEVFPALVTIEKIFLHGKTLGNKKILIL